MNRAFAGILDSDGTLRPETRTNPVLGHFDSITLARSSPVIGAVMPRWRNAQAAAKAILLYTWNTAGWPRDSRDGDKGERKSSVSATSISAVISRTRSCILRSVVADAILAVFAHSICAVEI